MNKLLRISFLTVSFVLFFSFSGSMNKAIGAVPSFVESVFDYAPNTNIVKCYPNPAVSYINFNFDNSIVNSKNRLVIYSFTGKKMSEIRVNSSILRVDLSAYFRGVYMYQVLDANGKSLDNGKFQIVK